MNEKSAKKLPDELLDEVTGGAFRAVNAAAAPAATAQVLLATANADAAADTLPSSANAASLADSLPAGRHAAHSYASPTEPTGNLTKL